MLLRFNNNNDNNNTDNNNNDDDDDKNNNFNFLENKCNISDKYYYYFNLARTKSSVGLNSKPR